MSIDIAEWLNLALRWLHLTAGIAWIGSSFYFVWLDNQLKSPRKGDASGEVWSVHGGGFYHKQKYQVAPSEMPENLHWFKWEAYFTWISGFALLVLIYFVGANTYLIDPSKARLTESDAIALAVAALAVGWGFYDLLCRSPLGRHDRIAGGVWFLFLIGMAAFLDSVFSSKAAYIQVGAVIGTAMVANVFFVIIPNQRRVVADLRAGRTPDPTLGQRAKQRSVHNNYMTLPVLFIMISQHYPMTYGADRPWLVLGLLGLLGVAIRHVFNLRHHGKSSPLLYAAIVLLSISAVTYVSLEKAARADARQVGATHSVTYAAVSPVIQKHCTSCHSANPTDPAFSDAPLGLALDSYEQVRNAAAKIKQQTVDADTMPLGNTTGMTEAERALVGQWLERGAPQ